MGAEAKLRLWTVIIVKTLRCPCEFSYIKVTENMCSSQSVSVYNDCSGESLLTETGLHKLQT